MSDGTKEYYLVTLAHNPGTRMQQVGDWLGGDGADKVTKWQLEKIAKQYLPKTMKIAGGLPLAIIGRLLEPSVTATEKFISLQYKEKSVNILLQGF